MTLLEELKMADELLANIRNFLKDRRPSVNAGYAIPTDEDIQQLYTIVQQLIELKFEEDPDRDLPIEFHLVNRTEGRNPYMRTVPYESKDLTGAFQGHIENLQTAVEEVNRIFRHIDSMKSYIEKIEQKYKQAR